MIAFASVLLGLVVGIVPVTFVVQEPVARVEVSLDGAAVGQITHRPWTISVDLGAELSPHELVARGFDAQGHLVGEVRQRLNVPRPLADAQIVVDADGRGAKVLWSSLLGSPISVGVTMDGKSVAVDASGRVVLPSYDRSTTHILGAKIGFPGNVGRDAVVLVGGGATEETRNALTAVPVRRLGRDRLPAVDRLQGWFARNGQPLRVLAVEHPPAEVVVVRELEGARALAKFGSLRTSTGVGPGGFPNPEITLKNPRLESDDRVRIAWPVPRRVQGSSGPAELFDQTREFTGEAAGFRSLLTGSRPVDAQSADYRTAEAVAVAGMRAFSGHARRAVVLVANDFEDRSTLAPDTVRRYLDRIRVPLMVWSLDDRALRSAWGTAEDVSSLNKLDKTVRRLKEELGRQEIVWVEGDYLPQEVQLTPAAAGFEIAASEGAVEPPAVERVEQRVEPRVDQPKVAREPSPPLPPRAQETAEVHVLSLEVFAADSRGRFVPDLAASELKVFLDGKLRNVDQFSKVDLQAEEKGQTPPRRFLVYVDLSRFSQADRSRVLESLREFIGRMSPDDSARIVSWNRSSREITPWTNDRKALSSGLDAAASMEAGSRLRSEGQAFRSVDEADAGAQGDLPEGLETLQRFRAGSFTEEDRKAAERMLADLDRQISTLSVVEGTRAILLVSAGIETESGAALSRYVDPSGAPSGAERKPIEAGLERAVRHANSARVTVFAVDPRTSADSRRPEEEYGLRRLSDDTGGLALFRPKTLQDGLEQVKLATSRYYSLGITLPAAEANKFRDIRVETSRPGISVRYRRGISTPTAGESAVELARTALLTRVDPGPIPVSIEADTPTAQGARFQVPVRIRVSEGALTFLPGEAGSRASAEVYFAASDPSGKLSDVTRREIAFTAGQCEKSQCVVRFPLEASKGKTRLAVVVRDSATGRRGVATHDLLIPDRVP